MKVSVNNIYWYNRLMGTFGYSDRSLCVLTVSTSATGTPCRTVTETLLQAVRAVASQVQPTRDPSVQPAEQ